MQRSLDTGPLRVGIVTHYWLPHMGGIEVLARDQAHRLADRGWDVSVFTSRLGGDPEVSEEAGVRVQRFRCTNILEARLGVPVPLMAPGMLKAIKQAARNLDVLVAHGHVYIGTMYAASVARSAGIPLIVIQHSPFVEYSNPVLNWLQGVADRTVGRAVFRRAARVIAVSDHTRRFVEAVAPGVDVLRVYPGVDLTRFRPLGHSSNGGRPVFLTVRRLVPRNGVEVLLRAWMDGHLGRDADLIVVGDGPLRTRLSDLAGPDPSVRFLGRLSDDDLTEVYQSADVFVLPTLSGEGYGLAVAEALASGLPAIVTDAGAPPEFVQDGVTGLVVPPGDAAALARAMDLFSRDPRLLDVFQVNVSGRRGELDRSSAIDMIEVALSDAIAEPRSKSEVAAA